MTTTDVSVDPAPKVRVVVEGTDRVAWDDGAPPELPKDSEEESSAYMRAVSVIVGLIVLAVVLAAFQEGDARTAVPRDGSADSTDAQPPLTTTAVSQSTADTVPELSSVNETPLDARPITNARDAANTAWPDPPADHDPHLIGRPMVAGFELDGASSVALLYVSSRGRPTLLDLTNGYQSELDIADERSTDRFLVDGGRVVSGEPLASNLPIATDRAIQVRLARTVEPGDDDGARDGSFRGWGPVLCLDGGGCPDLRWTEGAFGSGGDQIISLAGDPLVALEEFLAVPITLAEERWTFLGVEEDPDALFRVPTPLESTVVWLITQE